MTEVLFYQLSETSLEHSLPDLLEKSLQRGWRALVRGAQAGRMAALDEHLWTHKDESFLPHGMADGSGQPVFLSTENNNPNRADVLMLVNGARVNTGEIGDFQRVCLLFNGNDPGEAQLAREDWKAVVSAKQKAIYWAQENGRWNKKSESSGG